MDRSKLRMYFNILIGILFLIYIYLVIMKNFTETQWEICFFTAVIIVNLIRVRFLPKRKIITISKNIIIDNNSFITPVALRAFLLSLIALRNFI